MEEGTRTLSGLSADEFFKEGFGYSYSDFSTLDVTHKEIPISDISLRTHLGKDVYLELPILSAPMDRVTNSDICIAMSLNGGIGVLHYNYKKGEDSKEWDFEKQPSEIKRVKRFQNGFIERPITVSPDMKIAQVIALSSNLGIDVTSFPVTANGEYNGKLVGLLRRQDYFKGSRTDASVRERMLPIEESLLAKMPITLDQAVERIWAEHLQALPVVDDSGSLVYLVTRSDIEKREKYPLATLDNKNRLRVLFAVNTWPESYERLERGFDAGADGVVVDTSQGFGIHPDEMLKYIAKKYPDKLIIGGNVTTKEAVLHLAGLRLDDSLARVVDSYRNGQGSGYGCETENVIASSRTNATADYFCAKVLLGTHLITIADGGMRYPGHLVKALALGAYACMLGSMIAATDESPGRVIHDEHGKEMKEYWGMGFGRSDLGKGRGYSKMDEGKERPVEPVGSIYDYLPKLRSALLHAFEVKNCKSIEELHKATFEGRIRFERFMGKGHI